MPKNSFRQIFLIGEKMNNKLYYKMNAISNAICKFLTVCIIGIVIVNVGCVLLQILNRYVIVKISDLSFPWTEELSRFSMICMCYFTIPLVYREGSMAQLDLVFEHMGRKGRMVLYILTRILCIMFIVLAIKYGISVVQSRIMYHTPLMKIPGYVMYSIPLFGCALMAYEILTEFIGVCSGVLEPFYAGNKRQYPPQENGGKK